MSGSSNNETTVQKLLIDKPSDFRFHAAYLVYSDAWDKASSEEVKKQLNDIVAALSKNEIDHQTFYEKMRQYRVEFNPEHYTGREWTRIETQRKRDWRKKEERTARNARYRK